MSKRRRNKNNNSEQGCEVIVVDNGANISTGKCDTSRVDVPDDRTEEEKEKDFRINIMKDSEDDYVDAPDETKPDFGVSYDTKMAQILGEVSDDEDAETLEQEFEDSTVGAVNDSDDSSISVISKLKKVKEVFEPKSDNEPATLGGMLIITFLIIVSLIMIINLCSVMSRLPVPVKEKQSKPSVSVEVIDTSKEQGTSVNTEVGNKGENNSTIYDDATTQPSTNTSTSSAVGTTHSSTNTSGTNVIMDETGTPIDVIEGE